jgi:dipeptidyl aminopeptidase/acylaminoacyl peptidase
MDGMTKPSVAPYGSWKSPITSDLIVAGTVTLGEIVLDGEDVYWLEGRPSEGGRYVVVRRTPDGKTTDVIPAPFNSRTRVHEYGGGSYFVVDGTVYFSNYSDQRLYVQHPGSAPRPITPERELRFADGSFDAQTQKILYVCEDHTQAGKEAVNSLVSVNLSESGADAAAPKENVVRVLVSGNDFYSSPRLSPDGAQLAWLAWNHPNMPWDGSDLWLVDVDRTGGVIQLKNPRRIAGGKNESIFAPEWSPDGLLHFVSDRTGWWNLYRWREGRAECLCEKQVEFGMPQWVFGLSTYAFVTSDRILCTFNDRGRWQLAFLDTKSGRLETIEMPYTDIRYLRVGNKHAYFWAGSPTESSAIVAMNLDSHRCEVLRRSSDLRIDPEYISAPQSIEFPTENGRTAFAIYYPPKNRDFVGPAGEKPPLLVKIHGGPTSAATLVLTLTFQYWTSRGFAIVDVNYGGSTGYGREYRERLNGQWGVVDVDDCVNAAKFLVARGEVDGNRLTIDGGSAGGYTTLCALTFRDVFKAGASYFGISDLKVMDEDTHKFESQYSASLLGPLSEREKIYHERSPIHFIDRLSCPLILLQGLEDKIVPPNQAEMMFEAVRKKGIPVAYLPFEGEQHGFRRAENIKRALDAEIYFYSKVFGFDLADLIEPVKIENQ